MHYDDEEWEDADISQQPTQTTSKTSAPNCKDVKWNKNFDGPCRKIVNDAARPVLYSPSQSYEVTSGIV